MPPRAVVIAVIAVLALPSSAAAWIATHPPGGGDSVSYSAAPGETNTVTFGYETITDTTAVFDPTAQGSCAQGADVHTAQCSYPVSFAYIQLGDGNDKLTVVGASDTSNQDPTQIWGGSGRDDVTGGGANTEYFWMRDGEVDHINCDPPGADGKDKVEADDNDIVAANCDIVSTPTPHPVTLTVNTTEDDFDGICDSRCSLREAVKLADQQGGTVIVPPGDYTLTSPDNQLHIYKNVVIQGAGARATTIHAHVVVDWFDYNTMEPGSLKLSGVHLDGGIEDIHGALSVVDSTLSMQPRSAGFGDDLSWTLTAGDRAEIRRTTVSGRGVEVGGHLVFVNSTLSGNSAPSYGGVLRVYGPTQILNSTIAGNSGKYSAIYSALTGPDLEIANSIVSGNCSGLINTRGNNVGDASCGLTSDSDRVVGDPMLGPLQDNGGPTDTMALLPGSPAIDAGHNCVNENGAGLTTDQRGVVRPQGSECDSGAYEATPPDQPPPVADTQQTALEPPPIGPAVVPAPRIGSLSISPRRFRAATSGPAFAARRGGATVRYRLSAPGMLTVRVTTRGGSRVGSADHITARTTSGRFALTGRMKGKALRPGLYRLLVRLRTAAGAQSLAAVRSFRILPAAR